MTNHPNRNWRRHMQQAADQWMASRDATSMVVLLSAWPEWGRNQHARELIRSAYIAGYQDGRKRDE